jgi:hypothetical protein
MRVGVRLCSEGRSDKLASLSGPGKATVTAQGHPRTIFNRAIERGPGVTRRRALSKLDGVLEVDAEVRPQAAIDSRGTVNRCDQGVQYLLEHFRGRSQARSRDLGDQSDEGAALPPPAIPAERPETPVPGGLDLGTVIQND